MWDWQRKHARPLLPRDVFSIATDDCAAPLTPHGHRHTIAPSMSRTLSLPRPTVLLGFLLTGAVLAWSVMPARHIWHILHTLRLAPSRVSEFVLGAAVGAVAAVLLR